MASNPWNSLKRRALATKARKWMRRHHRESVGYASLARATELAGSDLELFMSGMQVADEDRLGRRLADLLASDPTFERDFEQARPLVPDLPSFKIQDYLSTYFVFVARDFSSEPMEFSLLAASRKPPEHCQIISLPTQGELWSKIASAIELADRTVAIIDEANANVAFEVGYSLAVGTPVALGVRKGESSRRAWHHGSAFTHYIHPPCASPDQIRGIILSTSEIALPSLPAYGGSPLFLYPERNENLGYSEVAAQEWNDLRVYCALDPQCPNPSELLVHHSELVWLVASDRSPDSTSLPHRDGEGNRANAYIAGYAKGSGYPLTVLQSTEADCRRIADLGRDVHKFSGASEFIKVLEQAKLAAVARNQGKRAAANSAIGLETDSGSLLRHFRQAMRSDHASLHGAFQTQSIERVVALSIARKSPDTDLSETEASRFREHDSGRRVASTLRELLESYSVRGEQPHYILFGAPGAGKTTTLRRLVYDLAQEPDGPIGLFLHAGEFAPQSCDPFATAAASIAPVAGQDSASHLATEFHRLAKDSDRLWVFVDGWDEIHEARHRAAANLRKFVESHPRLRIVVSSRETELRASSFGATFTAYELQGLSAEEQEALLRVELGDEAPRVHAEIQKRPLIRAMAGSPLILTLLSRICRDGSPVPTRRTELYQVAIRAYLGRTYENDSAPRLNETERRLIEKVLPPLAFLLHSTNEGSWLEDRLRSILDALPSPDAGPTGTAERALHSLRPDIEKIFGNSTEILRLIHLRSGLLAPSGGSEKPWSFLHRSFREFLSAQWIQSSDIKKFLGTRPDKKQEEERTNWLSQWAEVVTFLVGQQSSAAAQSSVLDLLAASGSDVFFRGLSDAHLLSLPTVLDLWHQQEERDGDDLIPLFENRIGSNGPLARGNEVLQWKKTHTPALSLQDEGCLLFALETQVAPPTPEAEALRSAYFRDRPVPSSLQIKTCPIPPDGRPFEFLMGSPEDVGYPSEHPQHRVRLTPFQLGKRTVTAAEFHLLSQPSDHPRTTSPSPPATGLSFWEAYLFCRWIGGTLPTEAQWEAACRAGTTTAFWFGDDGRRLQKYAYFGKDFTEKPRLSTPKSANPWGLEEMHGNVWEWCLDRFSAESYQLRASRGLATDPPGAPRGSGRGGPGGGYRGGREGGRSAAPRPPSPPPALCRPWGRGWPRATRRTR